MARMALFQGGDATRFIVGSNMGWTANVNYTVWAKGKHSYIGDWLFFVYDRKQMNVLEVNSTDYNSCNSDNPITNWTRGVGRDVVPLNIAWPHYFISGKGFCCGRMKLAAKVETPPPPPVASPPNMALASIYRGRIMPAVFALGVMWN